jgi:hypothetical protein
VPHRVKCAAFAVCGVRTCGKKAGKAFATAEFCRTNAQSFAALAIDVHAAFIWLNGD